MEIELSTTSRQPSEEEPGSFEGLFNRYYAAVVALFRRRGFTEGECEDLAQETFLKVYSSFSAYRGEAPMEHWLFRIASNTAKAYLRFHSARRRAGVVVPLDDAVAGARNQEPESEDPLRSLLASERSERLFAAVKHLPPRMRRCVLLFLKQDLRYREISEVLQISEQTVKVQLLRARSSLRELLSKEPERQVLSETPQ